MTSSGFTPFSFTRKSRTRLWAKRFCAIFIQRLRLTRRLTAGKFIAEEIEKIRRTIGENEKVVCGLSGGVDSTVAAALVHEAIGDRQTCIFVNNGCCAPTSLKTRLKFIKRIAFERARRGCFRRFYAVLKEMVDPETKRKAIGAKFIDVFDAEAIKSALSNGWCKELYIPTSSNPSACAAPA
jgi:3'-phosphoadenosine 5'-phosphosulfate sulfotransferase (PAPS reductase)/FAD synthetase